MRKHTTPGPAHFIVFLFGAKLHLQSRLHRGLLVLRNCVVSTSGSKSCPVSCDCVNVTFVGFFFGLQYPYLKRELHSNVPQECRSINSVKRTEQNNAGQTLCAWWLLLSLHKHRDMFARVFSPQSTPKEGQLLLILLIILQHTAALLFPSLFPILALGRPTAT